MQLTNLVWLAAALGATAHPSGLAHQHRRFHDASEKRGLQFFKAERQAITTTAQAAASSSATPTPTPSSSSTPTPSSATSSAVAASSSASSSSGYVDFCSSASKRATEAEIAYTGDTGTTWGCNIMLIDSDIADLYDYTTTYTNVADDDYHVVCWNKIGPTGEIDGFFGYTAVDFTLSAGESQVVAFEANSQGACGFAEGSTLPTTEYGEWAGTWVEFDFADSANDDWSGADCSSLVAQAAGLTVYGCQVCYDGTCSTIDAGGSDSTNAYVEGLAEADGLGLNIAAGNVALTVSVGYSG